MLTRNSHDLVMEKIIQVAGQLGLDDSVYYLFVLILVFHFALSITFARPFQKLLHKRKELIFGQKESATDLANKAQEKLDEYKQKLKNIHEASKKEMKELEERARAEEAKILGGTATKAKELIQNSLLTLEEDKKVTKKVLAGEINQLAKDIAAKVLGRPVSQR